MNKSVAIVVALVVIGGIFIWISGGSDLPAPSPEDAATPSESTPPAASVGMIDDERINNAASEPDLWLAYGRDYYEQRFSPLNTINRDSVDRLNLAWARDMGTNFALEATPIMVDGILFFTTSFSVVHAVDAKTGEAIWRYDPEVPREFLRKACCGPINRGAAVYKGRVYAGTLDGRLVALDAATGTKVWEVDTVIDHDRNYSITGAPRAARGKVFIGNGGAEYGVRGYVTAYDADTGDEVWRFFTVPGDPSLPFEHPEMELAAKTWKGGEWWKIGGGGTVWNSIVYDPDFNHLYLGVGNGAPWTRVIRSPGGGDNLFLASIVAVDADTGEMKWYYQTTPGDNWDYTAVQDMMLADMEVDGVQRKVLMQAPKNGFFYVLDRSNGELLRANPFVTTTWATHVDMDTGRPVENPELDYGDEPKWILPGPLGGHNWQAMSFNASTGVIYFPAQEHPLIYAMNEQYQASGLFKRNPGLMNLGIELGNIAQLVDDYEDDAPDSRGYLKAFDPLTGETLWSVEHTHYWNGGVLATEGGLVFQGDAMGTVKAYHSDTGEELWSFDTFTSILAPPMSYAIDGEQYVAILTGTGGGDHFSGYVNDIAVTTYGNFGKLLAFKLDGSAALERPTVLDRTIPEQQPVTASVEDLRRGNQLYHQTCGLCHGLAVASLGVMPDLRLMVPETHASFNEIVLEGTRAPLGMASFADVLTEADAERVHQYIISVAIEDRLEAEAEAAESTSG
jgi:quinohemoprotein ethanol dehydrogenase